jgi:hypothetical protein
MSDNAGRAGRALKELGVEIIHAFINNLPWR